MAIENEKVKKKECCANCIHFLPGHSMCGAAKKFSPYSERKVRRFNRVSHDGLCEEYRAGEPVFYSCGELKKACNGAKGTGFEEGETLEDLLNFKGE